MRAYDQAEAAFRHALVIRETLYGKTHADLISTVAGLAFALFGQQKYDQADPVYQRLIGLWSPTWARTTPWWPSRWTSLRCSTRRGRSIRKRAMR